MKKITAVLLVALSLAGCVKTTGVDTGAQSAMFNCSNAETGLTDTLTVMPGKIYVGSQGETFREVQSIMMNDGKPLIRYQGNFAVWYSNPYPILTNMKNSRYRLACIKKT